MVVDGALTDSTTTFTFMNVNTTHTIKAYFGINTTNIAVSEGWNLVSVPVMVNDKSKTALFPSAISSAYAFDPGAGYIPQDTLQNGVGYWLKFGAAENVGITGIPITRDSVNVIAGWNIIGSISSPVSADSIIQIPSGIVASVYYAFLGTYTAEDTLVPGKAYWVKVNSNGVLVLR